MAKKPGIFSLLVPYRGMIFVLLGFTLVGNAGSLWLPQIIARAIDAFHAGHFSYSPLVLEFLTAVGIVLLFSYLQGVVQTYASERVARDLRNRLSHKISQQTNAFVESADPSKLLTNLTADVDSIKAFIAQAIVSIVSSLLVIIGASILLLRINWQLALCVIAVIPIIGVTFFVVLRKVRVLYGKSRAVIDLLNKVINESILGSALVRVLNAQQPEYEKFMAASTKSRDIGVDILHLFAGLIPVITFSANLAALVILALGGHFVISGSLSLGDFTAFSSYLSMLIFPILVIGFMSNVIAQATASHQRIQNLLEAPDVLPAGTCTDALQGKMELKNVSLRYGQTPVLRDLSLTIAPGTKTAIIGPTAAGKTQVLYLFAGLTVPSSGKVLFDDLDLDRYLPESFYQQVGLVFQDSIIFNLSIRENIAFSETVTDADLEKAINTAELRDFVNDLPEGLNTVLSERGSSLSGGQKQRIMLARALAIHPRILLLDDFTARVDTATEAKILDNIARNYPGITLLSVTQKIEAVADYDQIILLMEGELIAAGKHQHLLSTCPEYVQLYESQQSTRNYEERGTDEV